VSDTPAPTRPPLTNRLGDGFGIAGWVLVVTGTYLGARALGAVPSTVGDVVASAWPLVVVAAGVLWAARGARAPGALLATIGLAQLAIVNLPGEAIAPALLILAGGVVLVVTVGGERFRLADAGLAIFNDVRRSLDLASPHALVALFGEVDARLDDHLPPDRDGTVACLAVFGSVRLEVPSDVAITVHQTAIFGDVRAPRATADAIRHRVPVRAMALFGDVRIVRV
jgi:hypothetical protein